MNVLLFIFIIITIFKNNISFRFYQNNNTLKNNFYNISISTFMNESILNVPTFENETKEGGHYFYIQYNESNFDEFLNSTYNDTLIQKLEDISFKIVKITNSTLNYPISYILSLNNISYSLIIIDYNNSNLIIDNNTSPYEKLLDDKNICYINNNTLEENKKFICKLDYLLFGYENLKDDVYLAKEIKEDNSIAYLDNFLSYSIFPEEYLDYFLTSFFSELNDECQKKDIQLKVKNDYNTFYYITCPKKKIEIYTKKRTLSVIINKISYKITDLFKDSLDFLNITNNDDNYYFNIIFEKNRKNFILGIGFFKKKNNWVL